MRRRMKIACVWIECRCLMVSNCQYNNSISHNCFFFSLQCFNYLFIYFFLSKNSQFCWHFFKPLSTTSNYQTVEPTHKHKQGVKNENSSFDEALKLTHKIQHWLNLCNYHLWQSWNCFFFINLRVLPDELLKINQIKYLLDKYLSWLCCCKHGEIFCNI